MKRRAAHFSLSSLSFRQILLLAFLLIAAVLSATSIHALLTLERLASQSRHTAREAVSITEDTNRLAELTVTMERSARQFLVLDDPGLRQRYLDAWDAARGTLTSLSIALPEIPPAEFDRWQASAHAGWKLLSLPRGRRQAADRALQATFAELPPINARLAAEGKREVERRNQAVLRELERQRDILPIVGAATIVLAAALALGFGMLLSQPMRQVQAAIGRLGQNRFDQPVEVHGPADMRHIGQQLEWLRQRLTELENEKARFLRQVSHELKTPLASLHEGVALLEDEVAGKLSAGQREVTGILRQSGLALQKQIEDLLRYNQAAFEAQALRRAPVDLAALLDQVIAEQRLQLQARRLKVEVEGKTGPLLADADKLGIVLANLLSNAVRFSPEGGVIRFTHCRQDQRVIIECLDQGPGVAPDEAQRIFEPFFQGSVQPPGARSGNGVGLSIVSEYVQAHGGSVELLPGQPGAHFRIELPDEV